MTTMIKSDLFVFDRTQGELVNLDSLIPSYPIPLPTVDGFRSSHQRLCTQLKGDFWVLCQKDLMIQDSGNSERRAYVFDPNNQKLICISSNYGKAFVLTDQKYETFPSSPFSSVEYFDDYIQDSINVSFSVSNIPGKGLFLVLTEDNKVVNFRCGYENAPTKLLKDVNALRGGKSWLRWPPPNVETLKEIQAMYTGNSRIVTLYFLER